MSGAPLTLGSASAGSSDFRSDLDRVHEENLRQDAAREAAAQLAGAGGEVETEIGDLFAEYQMLQEKMQAIQARIQALKMKRAGSGSPMGAARRPQSSAF